MKKVFLALFIAFAFVLIACEAVDENTSVPQDVSIEVSVPEESQPENSQSETEPETSFLEKNESDESKIELNETFETLGLVCNVQVITVPLAEKKDGMAGLWQFGNLIESPEQLPIGKEGYTEGCYKSDEGDPSYDEWILKYTDEWIEKNWLIRFTDIRSDFNCTEIGVYISNKDGHKPELLFCLDREDDSFDPNWMTMYYAFFEIPKESIKYDLIGFSFETVDKSTFDELIKEHSSDKTQTLPNGTLEKFDLDCEIEIIKMPFIADNPGIAGNFQFGKLRSTPDDLVLDDVMKSAYDTKDYDEWVKKYTDEWFKENWLIKFIVYEPSFDYKETGVYLSNRENSVPMLYFYLGEEKVRENVKPNDPHYYVFIEIPKENIKYDLTEYYFMTVTDLTYDSEIK